MAPVPFSSLDLTDERQYKWTYTTDRFGYQTSMTNPAPFNDKWTWARNEFGQVTESVEPAGAGGVAGFTDKLTTKYTYNVDSNLQQIEYADGNKSSWTYGVFNQITKYTDQEGRETITKLDSRGRAVTVTQKNTSGIWPVTSYLYTPAPSDFTDLPGGLVSYVRDPRQIVTKFEYFSDDARRGLLSKGTVAYGRDKFEEGITSYEYDANRNPSSITDPEGDVTATEYDDLNRLIQVTGPVTRTSDPRAVTKYTYDGVGNQRTVVDPTGNTTTFEYDKMNRLSLVTSPSVYNWLTDSTVETKTSYAYDATGNLQYVIDPRGGNTSFIYDQRGLKERMTLPNPGTSDHDAPYTSYAYDSAGNIKWSTEHYQYKAEGNSTTLDFTTKYSYDLLHRITVVSVPEPREGNGFGSETRTTYYKDGQIKTITEPGERTTQYLYDSLGRLKTITANDPDVNIGGDVDLPPATTTYTYYDDGLTQKITTLAGSTSYEYDGRGRLTKLTLPDPDGANSQSAPVTRYKYEVIDGYRVLKTIDPRQATTILKYDGADRVIEEISPDPGYVPGSSSSDDLSDNPRTTYSYYADGQTKTITNYVALGNRITSFEYDAQGRLATTADASGEIVRTYTAAGDLESMKDQNGNITKYAYDKLGRQIQVTQPAVTTSSGTVTPTTAISYDSYGLQRSITDPMGRVTRYEYDLEGHLTKTTFPYDTDSTIDGNATSDARFTTYTYYPDGSLWRMKSSDSDTTLYKYDRIGRQVSVTDEANVGTYLTYNANGQVASLKDASNNITSYEYDALGRKITESKTNSLYSDNPIGNRTYTYDANGNLETLTDHNGRVTKYTYDYLNRVIKEEWVGTDQVATFKYNEVGELLQASNSADQLDLDYDLLGRVDLISHNYGGTFVTLDPTYDNVGNRISVSAQINEFADFTTDYTPDALHRITEVHQYGDDVLPKGLKYSYRADGSVDKVSRYATDPSSASPILTSQNSYYADGRLKQIEYKNGDETPVARFEYKFVAAGQIQQFKQTDFLGNGTPTGGHLRDYSYDSKGQLKGLEIKYDDNGNRVGGESRVKDYNQLAEDSLYFYEYDGEGNRIRRTQKSTFVRIIDNTDPDFYWETEYNDGESGIVEEEFSNSLKSPQTEDPGSIGGQLKLSNSTSFDRTATWKFLDLPQGNYTVEMTWRENAEYSDQVAVNIKADGALVKSTTVAQNETPLGSVDSNNIRWQKISGLLDAKIQVQEHGSIVVSAAAPSPIIFGSYYGAADAIKITRIDGPALQLPGTQILDDQLVTASYNEELRFDHNNAFISDTNPGIQPFGNDQLFATGSGEAKAAWTFVNLQPGEYRVSATWSARPGDTVRMDYDLYNGPMVGSYKVGHYTTTTLEPNDFETIESGVSRKWEDVGVVAVTNGQLRVQMSNPPTDGVLGYADAIRIERLNPGQPITQYKWDNHSRLIEVAEHPKDVSGEPGEATKTTTYAYDALGRRVLENADGNITRFVYDGGQVAFETDASGEVTRRYLYDPSTGQPIAEEQILENDKHGVIWPIVDQEGSVRKLFGQDFLAGNQTYAVLQDLNYNDYGRDLPAKGKIEYTVTAHYAGRELDATGLSYSNAGYYDTFAHRSLNQDSTKVAKGDPNPYRFASNAPPKSQQPDPRNFYESLGNAIADVVGHERIAGASDATLFFSTLAVSTAVVLSGGTVGSAVTGGSFILAGAGTAAGLSTGLIQTYLSNPNASAGEYALGGGLGMITGAFGPGAALGELAGTLGGAAVGGKTGAQIGGAIGGLMGGGLDDIAKGATRMHAAKQTAVMGAIMTGVGGVAYAATGSVDSALFWANMATLPANLTAQKLVTCFPAGTELLTPTGSKRIEDFKVGDEILTRNEEDPDAPVVAGVVGNVFVRTGVTLELTVRGQTFRTTGEHPFWVKDRGWKPASELSVGDHLASHDHQWSTVEAINPVGRVETVYNLMVAEHHTYFVGSDDWGFSVWAHNAEYSRRQIKSYLDQIDTKANNRQLTNPQRAEIYKYLKENDVEYLGKEGAAAHRLAFDEVKDDLIKAWEANTGQSWPRYRVDVEAVTPGATKPFRSAGSRYDAHEIIPNSYGGPVEWWNIHPAKAPSQHQSGIHASGSIFQEMFPLDKG